MSDKQYHDFFSLYVVVVFFPKDYSGSGKEASMNQKQIGLFLKELRIIIKQKLYNFLMNIFIGFNM